jgi:hypothetical protein
VKHSTLCSVCESAFCPFHYILIVEGGGGWLETLIIPIRRGGAEERAIGTLPTTEHTECWLSTLFDILLNKYFPAG